MKYEIVSDNVFYVKSNKTYLLLRDIFKYIHRKVEERSQEIHASLWVVFFEDVFMLYILVID